MPEKNSDLNENGIEENICTMLPSQIGSDQAGHSRLTVALDKSFSVITCNIAYGVFTDA